MRTIRTPNEIIIKNNYCEMILYNRQCKEIARTIFDKKYLLEIKKYKWNLNAQGYCKTDIRKPRKTLRLHHLIIGKPPKGLETDHRNQNKLDNRIRNLRFVTFQQNSINTKIFKNNTSGVIGVYQKNQSKLWVANICINKKVIYLGCSKNKNKVIKLRKRVEKQRKELLFSQL